MAPVRGLTSELGPLSEALAAHPPTVVGLGTSPDELKALVEDFVLAPAEPVVTLTTAERSEVRGLVRFGEVRVPNPAFVELLRWGQARGIPVEPLDPSEDRTAALFTDHIGYVELVRRTVRERRVSRSPPTPTTADEYALLWDRTVAGGRGSRDFATARDRASRPGGPPNGRPVRSGGGRGGPGAVRARAGALRVPRAGPARADLKVSRPSWPGSARAPPARSCGRVRAGPR